MRCKDGFFSMWKDSQHYKDQRLLSRSCYCVMNASVSTDLRGLVGMELSLGPRLLQLLLQSFTLCPPLAHSLLGPGLQFISVPRALLE